MHCLHHALVGLDLQTRGAAEAVDVLAESWSEPRKGNVCSPLHRDAAKGPRGAAASPLCLGGPEGLWTVQQQGLEGLKTAQ